MIIPGFSNYDITPSGVVTQVSTGREIKSRVVKIRNSWYKQISLRDDDGYMCVYNLMTIIALAFMNKPLHEGVVRAKDGDNLNISVDNIVCTTQAAVAKQLWKDGKYENRTKRNRCYNNYSARLVYDVMRVYEKPVTIAELSNDLDMAYSTVRYSVYWLVRAGKVRKTTRGFEVIQ